MNFLKIDNCNMNNGDGLRCVIWVTGCEHHCKNCFNPETWDKNNGDEFKNDDLFYVFKTLNNDWCSGVTLTGGDPFAPCNVNKTLKICEAIKDSFKTKTIWVYTGYTFDWLKEHYDLSHIDVICDGEYVDELKSPDKHWVGSSNQNVIDVKESLRTGTIVLH